MDQISIYLKSLVSSNAYELHLEPNAAPFVLSDNGVTEVSATLLTGANISQLIFPIIPNESKTLLPDRPDIEFGFINSSGNFGFHVKKSPAGFHVIVKPLTNAPVQVDDYFVFDDTAVRNVSMNVTNAAEQPAIAPLGSKPPIRATDADFESSSLGAGLNAEVEIVDTYNAVEAGDLVPLDDYYFHAEVEADPYELTEEQEAMPLVDFEVDLSMSKKMDSLFYKLSDCGASDLHLSVSMPPMMRKDGKMTPLVCDESTMTPGKMKHFLVSIMPDKNREEFDRRHDTDFAYEVPGLARFRANIFMDRKGMGAVFRIIPTKILTAEQLNIPKAVLELCNLSKGLVVVTGPTGSGKSTTLAAMMDYLNDNREDHVITIEDPIEFVHENKKCLVNQREVHNHTDSFKDALRAALREDPDVLLVGEMRDLETIAIAIETAETGHLVFGTLHTTTAASTVDRIIDQFPADRQQQIRVMLSESLKGVIAQTLLPKKGGGRVAALEILIVTPAISNLIREGKTFQIPSSMQTGRNLGMTMLNDSMVEFVKQGVVEPRDAYLKSVDKTGLEMLFQRNNIKM